MVNPDLQSQDYSATDADEAELVSVTVPADWAGVRLDQALARLMPDFSRSRLQAWIRDGLVEVDGANVPT